MVNVSASDFDIIDEAIYYFKANIFFRTYEIKVCRNTHFTLVFDSECPKKALVRYKFITSFT